MPPLSTSGIAFFVALVGAPLVALLALFYEYRRGTPLGADAAATVLPTFVFIAVGATREEIQTGWAMIIWPVLIAMFSMYMVAAKLLVVQRFATSGRTASKLLLSTLLLGAATLGFTVPQILE